MGVDVGVFVGTVEGVEVGEKDGKKVGKMVGIFDGARVGTGDGSLITVNTLLLSFIYLRPLQLTTIEYLLLQYVALH